MSQDSNSSSRSMEENLTVLDYARLSGIARDHLAEPLGTFIKQLQDDLPKDDAVIPDAHLPQFQFPSVSVNERLNLSREGLELLATVTKKESTDDILLPMLDCRRARKLKVELPVLRSDHESDCREFARREGFETKLGNIRLPLEFVNELEGGGLSFPPHLINKGAEVLEQLKHEKLSVAKETMLYLKDIIKYTWTEEDERGLRSSLVTYKKSNALEPMTPPLLPMSPPSIPHEPTSSELEIPLLSDPASHTGEELEALEKKIFEQDVPTPIRKMNFQPKSRSPGSGPSGTVSKEDEINICDQYSPLKSWDDSKTPQETETKRERLQDLKIEETLTPPEHVPTIPKTVQLSSIIEEMILDLSPVSPSQSSDVLQDSFFQDAFGDAAAKATQMSEQEKLVEADATARVEVPTLDFSKPDPPWKKLERHRNSTRLEAMQRDMIREFLGDSLCEWPGVKRIHHHLRWQPFPPDLAKVALEESYVPDDSSWKNYIKDLEDGETIDSLSLSWKEAGLRILREEDDDDDEIAPGQFQKETKDLSSLVKKRKLEINDRNLMIETAGTSMKTFQRQRNEMSALVKERLAKKIAQNKEFGCGEPSKSNDSLSTTRDSQSNSLRASSSLLGGPFSAANALDNFLELRGSKKPKLADSSYFLSTSAHAPQNEAPLQKLAPQLPICTSPIAKTIEEDPLPAPPFNARKEKTSIIICSTFLKKRSLVREIQTLFPTLEFIERDYTRHNTTIWDRGSVSRSPKLSPLASEADLNLSPSTGMILTNLQKVKQKVLPGQKNNKSAIRDRIEKVSLRYEKLVVLVSEENTNEHTHTNGLTDDQALALSEFIAFTTGLPCTIAVHYIPGTETELAKWLVCSIINHSTPDPETGSQLLEEETHWELFLRRSGLNAFAAQVIVGSLKAPEGVDEGSESKGGLFGLTAFVEMGGWERCRRFEGVLGGRRVLERVGAVVDGVWE